MQRGPQLNAVVVEAGVSGAVPFHEHPEGGRRQARRIPTGRPVWRRHARLGQRGVGSRAAGPKRNGKMLCEAKPDGVATFPDCRGALNCVEQAEQLGIPFFVMIVLASLVWLNWEAPQRQALRHSASVGEGAGISD